MGGWGVSYRGFRGFKAKRNKGPTRFLIHRPRRVLLAFATGRRDIPRHSAGLHATPRAPLHASLKQALRVHLRPPYSILSLLREKGNKILGVELLVPTILASL